MSEVAEASAVASSMTFDPITGLGLVASRSRAPDGYTVVAQTCEGWEADLWKDGLFKSKVDWVLVDLMLAELKDPLPPDFIPILETMDTKEPALQKKRLCVKFAPRVAVETAVCDIQVSGRSKNASNNFTFVGEMNGMSIWYKLGKIPQPQGLTLASLTLDDTDQARTPSSPSYRQTRTRPDFEHQNSGGIYTISAMDGIPFTVSEMFLNKSQKVEHLNLMGITIKSAADIEEEYQYCFNTEFSCSPYLSTFQTQKFN